jgi:hypothetical protein
MGCFQPSKHKGTKIWYPSNAQIQSPRQSPVFSLIHRLRQIRVPNTLVQQWQIDIRTEQNKHWGLENNDCFGRFWLKARTSRTTQLWGEYWRQKIPNPQAEGNQQIK